MDGDYKTKGSKWADAWGPPRGNSTIQLHLPHPVEIEAYEFWTANDNPDRDPVAWIVERLDPTAAGGKGAWRRVDQRAGVAAPHERYTSYGTYNIEMPPPAR